jgi:hypothetical protein
MSLLVKQSVRQIKCEVVGHTVSREDEDKLFNNRRYSDELYAKCSRCGANVLLKINSEKNDEYFLKEY